MTTNRLATNSKSSNTHETSSLFGKQIMFKYLKEKYSYVIAIRSKHMTYYRHTVWIDFHEVFIRFSAVLYAQCTVKKYCNKVSHLYVDH